MTNTTKRFWFFGTAGRLIVSLEMESFEAARQLARERNAEGPHSTLGYFELISDAPNPAHGRVTTVDVVQFRMPGVA